MFKKLINVVMHTSLLLASVKGVQAHHSHMQSELYCLAQNIYFEARSEGINGMEAVANVTMNRVDHPKFPDSVCGVVWQNKQFSWTHDGKSDKPHNKIAWERAKLIASDVYHGMVKDNTNGSLFYHADYVNPSWAKSLVKAKVVGSHIFYIWDGKW